MVGRFGWRDVLLFVLAGLVALLVLRSAVTQSRFVAEGKEAHDYLCYQKQVGLPRQIVQSRERIQSSLDYVIAVQLGRRKAIPGITEADIQTGVQREQDNIARIQDSLKHLREVTC